MNLYAALDDYYVYPVTWQAQQIIAKNEKEARKVLPYGSKRKVVLLMANIDKPIKLPKGFGGQQKK